MVRNMKTSAGGKDRGCGRGILFVYDCSRFVMKAGGGDEVCCWQDVVDWRMMAARSSPAGYKNMQ